MQRLGQIGAMGALVWLLVAPRHAVAQGPAAASGAGSQAGRRFVVFEAFMRIT